MHKLSDVEKKIKKIIKSINMNFLSDEIEANIKKEFSIKGTSIEEIKILKHIIAYSEYHIYDFPVYFSYFALFFTLIALIFNEGFNKCLQILVIFCVIATFIYIFYKNRKYKKFYILKTIASDMVQELENRMYKTDNH